MACIFTQLLMFIILSHLNLINESNKTHSSIEAERLVYKVQVEKLDGLVITEIFSIESTEMNRV